MTIDLPKLHDLFSRLIEALIDHPQQLTLEIKDLDGRIDWAIQVHAEDHGKIIGRDGAHFNALAFLFAVVGMRLGQQFSLRPVRQPIVGRRPAFPAAPRSVDSYNTDVACRLLVDLVATLTGSRIETLIEKVPASSLHGLLAYKFTICPETEDDYKRLAVAPDDNIAHTTVVAAIGTLFRAYARRDGVEFSVEVPPR